MGAASCDLGRGLHVNELSPDRTPGGQPAQTDRALGGGAGGDTAWGEGRGRTETHSPCWQWGLRAQIWQVTGREACLPLRLPLPKQGSPGPWGEMPTHKQGDVPAATTTPGVSSTGRHPSPWGLHSRPSSAAPGSRRTSTACRLLTRALEPHGASVQPSARLVQLPCTQVRPTQWREPCACGWDRHGGGHWEALVAWCPSPKPPPPRVCPGLRQAAQPPPTPCSALRSPTLAWGWGRSRAAPGPQHQTHP